MKIRMNQKKIYAKKLRVWYLYTYLICFIILAINLDAETQHRFNYKYRRQHKSDTQHGRIETTSQIRRWKIARIRTVGSFGEVG